jgi:Flp pilus assembly protein TadG
MPKRKAAENRRESHTIMNAQLLPIQRRRACRRGTQVVELAVIAPIIVLLILGAIDLGQFINGHQHVSNASREGARIAARARTSDASQVEAAIQEYLEDSFPNVPSATLSSAVNVAVTDEDGSSVSGGDLADIDAGTPLTVRVTLQFQAVRWISGLDILGGQAIETATITRRE